MSQVIGPHGWTGALRGRVEAVLDDIDRLCDAATPLLARLDRIVRIGRAPAPRTAARVVATPASAYCLTCRAWRVLEDPIPTTLDNSRAAIRGTCATCGAALVKLGGSEPPAV